MRRFGIVLLLLVWACGGGTSGTTTAASAETATTAAPAETTTTAPAGDDGGELVSVDDVPAECVDAFVTYLKEVEPFVEGVDFQNLTQEEMEPIFTQLEGVNTSYDETLAGTGCEDINVDIAAEGAQAKMLALAEDEAPGTVSYLTFLFSFAGIGGGDGGNVASGDCETDIDKMQVWVDGDKNMSQLTMGEVPEVFELLTAIQTECSVERFTDYFDNDDVTEFMGG
jgi:hypothetical protein